MEKKISNRLRRLRGQIERLERDIINDAPCDEVVTQFLAVKGAANATFNAYVSTTLARCQPTDRKKLEQLITALIQK